MCAARINSQNDLGIIFVGSNVIVISPPPSLAYTVAVLYECWLRIVSLPGCTSALPQKHLCLFEKMSPGEFIKSLACVIGIFLLNQNTLV